MTVKGDHKDYYRVDGRPYSLGDDIAYSAGLEVPEVAILETGAIEYYFKSCNVTVGVENYDPKGNAEIRAWAGQDGMVVALAYQQINLMSQRAVAGLVRDLKESQPQVETWRQIINNVAWRTMQMARASKPLLTVGTQPETMRQDFRLFPIIHEGEPTTIYCPGGVGKSYLAVFCACLVQFDYAGFTDEGISGMWAPRQGNVLYLDWEASHSDHLRRTWAVKRGLGIEGEGTFLYLPCEQPLSVIVPDIRAIIEANNVAMVVIDSQMAAADFGPDMAQNATRFFNGVRQLHCSALILDHVSKAAMATTDESTNSAGPHGSVVKANRSRQQYELRKHQVPGQSYTDLVLIHRKNNEGPLADEFGIRLTFKSDDNGHLDRVTFKSFNVSEHPIMSATQALWKRLWDALDGVSLTTKELHEYMADKTEDTIRVSLNRYKDKFAKLEGDRWARRAIG